MRLIKNLEKRNEWFNSLSKKEKRIEICKDLIKQLKAKKFQALTGSYFSADSDEKLRKDDSLQELIENGTLHCEGCHKAGLFYSAIRLRNKVTVKGYDVKDCSLDYYNDNTRIVRSLADIFTRKQLDLMEVAFEYDMNMNCENLVRKNRIKAADFGRMYENDDDRMIAICKNIIKNEGLFKL